MGNLGNASDFLKRFNYFLRHFTDFLKFLNDFLRFFNDFLRLLNDFLRLFNDFLKTLKTLVKPRGHFLHFVPLILCWWSINGRDERWLRRWCHAG